MSEQDWDDEEFCELYEEMWEISTDDVHYGWLAPGESELALLSGMPMAGGRVLDIGCGLGQNLIALAKIGCEGVGVDISRGMIRRAKELTIVHGLEESIAYHIGDMRDAKNLEHGGEFDVVLSVYSMEYLSTLRELRGLLYSVHKQLKPGGAFVFCFSHPSQASRYPEFMNRSVPIGVGKYRTFNYSFKDVTEALFKAGFTIERIVEQGTRSPSKLTYDESNKFPYHFHDGKNPCQESFDELSNGSPHTIIYKARRYHEPLHGLPRRARMSMGYREVWGYKRQITKIKRVSFLGLSFDALYFAPMDNVVGLMDVLNFSVTSFDVAEDIGDISIVTESGEEYFVDGNSIFGLIHRKAVGHSLLPVYKDSVVASEEDEFEQRVYMADVAGLGMRVRDEYDTQVVGLLVFVNGHEPIRGELPVDQILASPGDVVTLTYVALNEGSKAEKLKRQLILDL